MESSSMAKRLWHVLRAVCYMLRKGISKRKLTMELQLLLRRGKLAGKAIANLMTLHPHHRHHHGSGTSRDGGLSSLSCRSIDPNLACYTPQGVEFSCSNTPAYSLQSITKKSSKHRRRRHDSHYYDFDAATVAKAFEILSAAEASDDGESSTTAAPSPSPATLWFFGKSPAVPVRRVRITDSPFPIREEEEDGGRVDRAAEDFIKRFHEQLQQQMAAATPEYNFYKREQLTGRA